MRLARRLTRQHEITDRLDRQELEINRLRDALAKSYRNEEFYRLKVKAMMEQMRGMLNENADIRS